MRLLIESGADLDAHVIWFTSLHSACRKAFRQDSDSDIFRNLILAGADTQLRDKEGRLAIELLTDAEERLLFEEAVEEAVLKL
jgi:hypothetical protein